MRDLTLVTFILCYIHTRLFTYFDLAIPLECAIHNVAHRICLCLCLSLFVYHVNLLKSPYCCRQNYIVVLLWEIEGPVWYTIDRHFPIVVSCEGPEAQSFVLYRHLSYLTVSKKVASNRLLSRRQEVKDTNSPKKCYLFIQKYPGFPQNKVETGCFSLLLAISSEIASSV